MFYPSISIHNTGCVQVYLVTGGQTLGRFYEVLDSTELLVAGAASWVTAGPLPSHRFGLRGVTLNNKIIMTGHPSIPVVSLLNRNRVS